MKNIGEEISTAISAEVAGKDPAKGMKTPALKPFRAFHVQMMNIMKAIDRRTGAGRTRNEPKAMSDRMRVICTGSYFYLEYIYGTSKEK